MNNLSLSQKQVILGGLLGDSCYNKQKKSVFFNHSEKQLEYLLWKKSFFNEEDLGKFRKINYVQKYVGYCFPFINRKNKYADFFTFIEKNLYTRQGRKKISLKYLKQLTPLGLAIWWLDDGCLSIHKGNRYGKLCTHCFNYEENILIQKFFKQEYDINVDIKVEKGKYYFIRFNVTALKKLITIIYQYVIQVPSMIYKIDLNYSNAKWAEKDDFKDIYNFIKSKKQ